MAHKNSVVVIGGGIVGVSAALWLTRRGREVTLIDRAGAAARASVGNAGVINPLAVVPLAMPGLGGRLPAMALSSKSPYFVLRRRPRTLRNFVRAALRQSGDADRIAQALAYLVQDAPDQHAALAAGTPAAAHLKRGGLSYAYSSAEAFAEEAEATRLRKAHHLEVTDLNGTAPPGLGDGFSHGLQTPEAAWITDPSAYLQGLKSELQRLGGTIVHGTVLDWQFDGAKATSVTTDKGQIRAAQFALTAGAWSRQLSLVQDLGVRVQVVTERGYQLDYHAPNLALPAPVILPEHGLTLSPLRGTLRVSGGMEFTGLQPPASPKVFAWIRKRVAQALPELTADFVTEWMGHRATTPDSLPVIGRSPTLHNVHFGYGHQNIGMTAGPKTGWILSQLITGSSLRVDLSAFAPDREV